MIENLNKGTTRGQQLIEKSLRRFGAARGILVDKNNRIIAGNKTQLNAGAAGIENVIIVETTGEELVVTRRTDVDLDSDKGREMALADNATTEADLAWDTEEMNSVVEDYGIEPKEWDISLDNAPVLADGDEIERKQKEFYAKMAAGELSEDNPEYQAFLAKFEVKKTTDDCYTPAEVYDAVAGWVEREYKVNRADFVRPFYPGGDYQKEKYKATDIVVDNPPFSILAEILQFYVERGIRFFLFAPHLTLFSSNSSCTALPVGVPITYNNGAVVNTSFMTDMEDESIRFRSEPRLYAAVRAADEITRKQMKKELPKYIYDHHVVTTPIISAFSRLGIDFSVPVSESEVVSQLDCQKDKDKRIYGKGYLVSDRVFAEREKAEREKAEREKAERWGLSQRELQIISRLNKKEGKR